ncbi:MAG: twin-arginine translocase TatA/TatE family subunit [Chitinivibrionia bacterium]|nr:twin-arginine translocase TatA/TatE family subunit [Chitinivibrionia bacterium]
MGNIGIWNILVILLIFLLLFGAKKLPELAKGLGSGIREFKKAAKEVEDELSTDKSVAASEQTANDNK